MKIIKLDFTKVNSERALHDYLIKKFSLPTHYGRNLDAFWDCLMELEDYTLVEMKNIFCLYGKLGDYSAKFLKTLDDAALENKYLWLKVLE